MSTSATLYHGDCLDVMPTLGAGSVAMVFADLPYGALKQMAWDVPICPVSLWREINRVSASKAAQVLTANIKFATSLIASNYRSFSYDLVWEKSLCTAPFLAKKRPLPVHELILVFNKPLTYNPQMRDESLRAAIIPSWTGGISHKNKFYMTDAPNNTRMSGKMSPRSVISKVCGDRRRNVHPTQKPVALLEWLIATYTNPGDTVLDPVFGSATTGVACARLGRHFVGIEMDETYFAQGRARLDEERAKLGFEPCEAITFNNP